MLTFYFSLWISRRESLHRLKNSRRDLISFTLIVKNSQMEWTGVEFEIHGVKTQIHAPWPWKKFTVFGEIHKPPFRVKGHILFFLEQHNELTVQFQFYHLNWHTLWYLYIYMFGWKINWFLSLFNVAFFRSAVKGKVVEDEHVTHFEPFKLRYRRAVGSIDEKKLSCTLKMNVSWCDVHAVWITPLFPAIKPYY